MRTLDSNDWRESYGLPLRQGVTADGEPFAHKLIPDAETGDATAGILVEVRRDGDGAPVITIACHGAADVAGSLAITNLERIDNLIDCLLAVRGSLRSVR